jgi:hypothetical protein
MHASRTTLVALLFGMTCGAAAQDPPPWEMPAPAPPEPAAASPDAPNWGTGQEIFVGVPAISFFPANSTVTYTSDAQGRGRRWATSVPNYFQAPVHLPEGARVTSIRISYVDNSPTGAVFGQLVRCDYVAIICTQHPTTGVGPSNCRTNGWLCSGRAEADTFPHSTSGNIFSENLVIQNLTENYYVNIYLPTVDATTKIAGAMVGYYLQVSPAPATARFPTDVPTTHPYFRFIEALAASGISSGCGGTSFCPDAHVSRGEMAVFLSVALGLHWAPPLAFAPAQASSPEVDSQK